MAHFAKISEENIVLNVHVVADEHCTNKDGVETEAEGQYWLEKCHGWPQHLWKKTSYNTINNTHTLGGTPYRGNYAGIGFIWDPENEIFLGQKPGPDWTKDVANAKWVSPLGEAPALTAEQESQNEAGTHFWIYEWDEAAYQADNTTGWTLTNLDA
tara:strand:+ start:963 stop:1430 length:468 start_codon:yes stop_codon:yes gene_type:complete